MQTFLVQRAASILSKNLKTVVTVKRVSFSLLNHIDLQGVFIEDHNNDTLLYTGKLQVSITDWFFFKVNPVIHYIELNNAYVHLYRTKTSDKWNYAFLEDFFTKGKKDTSSDKPPEFDLKKIALENVRFHMDDGWFGWDMNYDIGKLDLNVDIIDYKNKKLNVSDIFIDKGIMSVKAYPGGKGNDTSDNKTVVPIQGININPDNWLVNIKKISVNNCGFYLSFNDTLPKPGEFDNEHIYVSGIKIKIKDCKIVGETVKGFMEHLEGKERCGIAVKDMHSNITVSPTTSVCENLYLETNNSKLKNYFALHYKRYPDFLSYIDSVSMVGRLKDAIIDEQDIAFFAPLLKTFPKIILHATGEGRGTVANFAGYNLNVTDGATSIKCSGSIKGLPDVFRSKIKVTDLEILSSGEGILRYVPSLRNSPDVAFEQLLVAHFKGTYEGLLDSFAVKGDLKTNLGNITTDIKLSIPDFKTDSARYTGTISADSLQLGIFLHKKDILVGISLNEYITGFSFNPDFASVNLDGTISELKFNGYNYKNISTKCVLAKKQFIGDLLVDDPNLALGFNGSIDYTTNKIKVKAKANLLNCNFKELKLTEDNFKASADFDLNCTGSNIDNFFGYALLNNIKIKRNNNKLAIDSVYLKATGDSLNKILTIQSNAVFAKIKGNYKLSKLPASFQYYLSKYVPGYISAPTKDAPDQNLDFVVITTNIDSIFAITLPWIRGFDNSYISGLFNTETKKLELVAKVPFGSMNKVRMNNIDISCHGNLDILSMNTVIDNVTIGDSSINGSVGITASLGNDSMNFNIATTTPEPATSIVLNGQVLARRDSLFLTMLPSAFYLNKIRWDIDGGCKITYSNKYLLVDNLGISSGSQKITAGYQQNGKDQSILINTESVDLGQLGKWAGLNSLQPDGRLNGTIKIINVLSAPYIKANLKATNVKLGTDTLGTVNIIGDYDHQKKLAIIDPQTGIFYGDASIIASGRISFDSNTNQKLDGLIKFINTPVAFASPFLAGIFSKLSGILNGTINIGGKSYAPEINGTVELKKGGFHLDYMGCSYKIPSATVFIDNQRINLGIIKVEDYYNNSAIVTGYFSHTLFKDMKMHIKARSERIEIMKLSKTENNYFYGNAIAGMDSFTVIGPFNDFSLNAYNLYPAAKSHVIIPMASTGDSGTYSYVSFKTYNKVLDKTVKKNQIKINVNMDANLNDLAVITILLDPIAGDAIDAKGDGNIQLKMPANNDMRITGAYNIESGTYTFTFKQLEYKKQFSLNAGSTIYFRGPFSSTTLDVYATYTAKARLFDLLSATEQTSLTSTDQYDAKRMQPVNIVLHMQDALLNSKLSFDLNVEDKRLESNPAYTKLQLINQDERQKFDQVASLLLTGNFLSQDGLFGNNSVKTGALNNFSQMLSGTASSALTSVVNKLIGERKVNINVNYQNYNYSDIGISNINRNQFTGTISKNYLNDRLIIEAGAKSDWGQIAYAGASSYNISGDFRVQYLINPSGGLRLNCFSTGDYDLATERQITRNGVGFSWRKSFDNFNDLIKSDNKIKRNIKTPKQKVNDSLKKLTLSKNDIQ